MAMSKAYQTYQNNSVNTATSGELTLKLYNGCIKFIKQAMQDLENKNYEAKNTNIKKSQNIIHELMVTLDMNIDISRQIMPLYEYIQYQLKEANIKNDSQALEEALNYVVEFRDTWKEVLKITRQQQYVKDGRV
ncbi:flagellar export chaperone FliS [Lentibacillus cibarius]|uniref:Flagellar secretion chaperone FliS n=1 Tax=Lentibacillus cibarius TaxID=2583219 RepID=A0A549YEC0_9BACI|nr:flagellar export chaperone FliS [Lentibacillus cibarius]TRM10230.1 flagellar export chaperone FliS [Lentibacillus cibarius]